MHVLTLKWAALDSGSGDLCELYEMYLRSIRVIYNEYTALHLMAAIAPILLSAELVYGAR